MSGVTAFAPPASCSQVWWGTLTGDTGGAFRQGLTCPQRDGKLIYDNNCVPVNTPPISAGCPVGWATASSGAATVGCCPSRYNLVGGGCIMPVTSLTTVIYPVCRTDNASPTTNTGTYSTGYTFYARPVYLTSPTPTPTPTPVVVTSERVVTVSRSAPGSSLVPVVVTSVVTVSESAQAVNPSPSSPRPNAASSGSTVGAASSGSTVGAVSSGSTVGAAVVSSSTTPVPGPPGPALSTGAIAGIAVGGVALLALAGLAIFFLLRRRKRKNFAQPPPASNEAYSDTKPELAATGAIVGSGYGRGTNNKQPTNDIEEKQTGMTTLRPVASSPVPPSELSTTAGGMNTPSYHASPVMQHPELPSYAPGGQPYTYMAGGEMDGTATHHQQYVENTGPYYPEAYAAPVSADQARASRLAELESSQRELESRMARMRHMSAMEEEYERTQAEIARLRSGHA